MLDLPAASRLDFNTVGIKEILGQGTKVTLPIPLTDSDNAE